MPLKQMEPFGHQVMIPTETSVTPDLDVYDGTWCFFCYKPQQDVVLVPIISWSLKLHACKSRCHPSYGEQPPSESAAQSLLSMGHLGMGHSYPFLLCEVALGWGAFTTTMTVSWANGLLLACLPLLLTWMPLKVLWSTRSTKSSVIFSARDARARPFPLSFSCSWLPGTSGPNVQWLAVVAMQSGTPLRIHHQTAQSLSITFGLNFYFLYSIVIRRYTQKLWFCRSNSLSVAFKKLMSMRP